MFDHNIFIKVIFLGITCIRFYQKNLKHIFETLIQSIVYTLSIFPCVIVRFKLRAPSNQRTSKSEPATWLFYEVIKAHELANCPKVGIRGVVQQVDVN